MPRYEYACPACAEHFDMERAIAEAGADAPCPHCGARAKRVITSPKFLFKPDPNDVRPVWHNHGGFGHAHPPRRGRHPAGIDDH